MITRQAWGAKGGQGSTTSGLLALVVIHHSASPDLSPDATEAEERGAVRGIESWHIGKPPQGRGWAGIGYNWLIAPSGRTYEGRGWRRAGAHAAGHNSRSVGICFIQDGNKRDLTPAAVDACRMLLTHGLGAGHLAEGFAIRGHRDMGSTECPGLLVYRRLNELRPNGHAPDHNRLEIRRALDALEAETARQIGRIRAVLGGDDG